MSGLEVVGQEVGERAQVLRDQDPILAFGPDQDIRILAAEREISRITNLYSIDRWASLGVVVRDGRPEPIAKILVEEEADGHASGRPGTSRGFQPPAQLVQAGALRE